MPIETSLYPRSFIIASRYGRCWKEFTSMSPSASAALGRMKSEKRTSSTSSPFSAASF